MYGSYINFHCSVTYIIVNHCELLLLSLEVVFLDNLKHSLVVDCVFSILRLYPLGQSSDSRGDVISTDKEGQRARLRFGAALSSQSFIFLCMHW